MNETNRTALILLAALWIVLMAVVIFLTWTAGAGSVDRLGDLAEYLAVHEDENASRLIVTLSGLVLIVLSLLLIVVELAPEEETREIRVEQAGATTIVPAEPLRLRLEEALTAMPQVSAARARVYSHDRGIGMKLDLTVVPGTNLGTVTQEASRVVVDALEADLGLPVSAPPTVRIQFGPPKPEPVASSVTQAPKAEPLVPSAGDTPALEEMWPSQPATTPEAEAPAAGESALAGESAAAPAAPSPELTWPPTPPAQSEPQAPAPGEDAPRDQTAQP